MFFIFHKKQIFYLCIIIFLLGLLITYASASHPQMENWISSRMLICQYDTGGDKAIALTFDDGPNPQATPQILDTLRRYHAHATFFVIGNKLEENQSLLHSMVQDGHEIGSHSYTHADFNTLSSEMMYEEIQKTNEAVEKISGKRCIWFRPPGGFLSSELIENIIPSLQMKTGYWSYIQDSKDWKNGRTAQEISQHILKNIQPGQIILLHDGCQNSPQTAQAVEIILQNLSEQGYQFFSLNEMEAQYGSAS